MLDYIPISTLNDFIFCPYSIYLHNVYMEADESLYHAVPQTAGRIAHAPTDAGTASSAADVLLALPVYSERFHLMGVIDVYRKAEKKLIERKNNLKHIFQGQIYQLWAQMFCLRDMGYEVESLAFYEITTHKTFPVAIPTPDEELQFERFLQQFHQYNPADPLVVNPNKCAHCIYCNICDKTDLSNVYS